MLQISQAIQLLPLVIAKLRILPICSLQSHISFSRSYFFCCSCQTVFAFILYSPTSFLSSQSFFVQQDRDFFSAQSQRCLRVVFSIQSSRSSAIYSFRRRFSYYNLRRYLLYLLTIGTRCSMFSWLVFSYRFCYFCGRGGCQGFFFLKSGCRMAEGLTRTVGSMVLQDFWLTLSLWTYYFAYPERIKDSLAFLSGHFQRALSIFISFCLAFRNSETSKFTSPACLLPFSLQISTVNLVQDNSLLYQLVLKFLSGCIEGHIALELQWLIESNDAVDDLATVLYQDLFLAQVKGIVPLLQLTATKQGNFRARVTVWTWAVKLNLQIFWVYMTDGLLLQQNIMEGSNKHI